MADYFGLNSYVRACLFLFTVLFFVHVVMLGAHCLLFIKWRAACWRHMGLNAYFCSYKKETRGVKVDFQKDLNESQRMAVEYCEGPSLVIAGAGSGKTRVLTYKIAYLMQEKGLAPWNILALTFTNKAAREMKERIANLVGEAKASALWMGTFHSLFSRMLRQEAALIGFTPNYTIYQPADSKSLVKEMVKEMGLDDKIYKPALVCARISEAKNALVMPEAYAGDPSTYKRDAEAGLPMTGVLYKEYAKRMRRAGAMDFDDLLLYTYLLFVNHPETCCKYAERFSYILVDEYQDTNFAQFRILQLLAQATGRICVVGDDAQSIYSFRGARIDNILQFTDLYKGARLFKLEQNYRSTQTIVQAANSLISYNKRQIKKQVFSKNDAGKPLTLDIAYSDVEEGEIVCNRIAGLHRREGVPYGQMAVLYRTNAQSRIFEEGLRKRTVPYRIYGGQSFYDQKEIRDVLAYFRLTVNPNDEEALKRIINVPKRGIGTTTVGRLIQCAHENETGIHNVMADARKYGLPLSSATLKKLDAFRDMMAGFTESLTGDDAYTLGERILKESGIWREAYSQNDAESMEVQNNLSELLNGINSFVEMQRESGEETHCLLTDYLSEVSLLSDQDSDDGDDDDRVTLMTVHAAKGLEFDAVFVVGMEENLFPNAMCMHSERQLEEERRLFYVAITRARRYCHLSASKSRFKYGKMEFCEPSSFLYEINRKYLRLESGRISVYDGGQQQTQRPAGTVAATTVQRRLKPVGTAEATAGDEQHEQAMVNGQLMRVGDRVEHERFGQGTIAELEGDEGNMKALIDFDNSGKKKLLLKYAKVKIVN